MCYPTPEATAELLLFRLARCGGDQGTLVLMHLTKKQKEDGYRYYVLPSIDACPEDMVSPHVPQALLKDHMEIMVSRDNRRDVVYTTNLDMTPAGEGMLVREARVEDILRFLCERIDAGELARRALKQKYGETFAERERKLWRRIAELDHIHNRALWAMLREKRFAGKLLTRLMDLSTRANRQLGT